MISPGSTLSRGNQKHMLLRDPGGHNQRGGGRQFILHCMCPPRRQKKRSTKAKATPSGTSDRPRGREKNRCSRTKPKGEERGAADYDFAAHALLPDCVVVCWASGGLSKLTRFTFYHGAERERGSERTCRWCGFYRGGAHASRGDLGRPDGK